MANQANIEPYKFKPGQSGNPKGRPKGSVSLVRLLRAKLSEVPPGQRKDYATALIEATIRDALKKDGQSRRLVWEYLEGKPTGEVQVSLIADPVAEAALADEEVRELLDALLTRIAGARDASGSCSAT